MRRTSSSGFAVAASCWMSLLWTAPALAHEAGGEAAGFLTGLGHPVSGLDHVLVMLAVGLWGAQLGLPALWMLPVAFPMMMAMGGTLALIGLPFPGVEAGIALSAVVLGTMILLEARPPLVGALMIVGLFALFHGHSHGTELPEGQNGLLYSIGFVASTGTLHAFGIAIGTVNRWYWGRRALRLAGAAVAAAGAFFLVGALG